MAGDRRSDHYPVLGGGINWFSDGKTIIEWIKDLRVVFVCEDKFGDESTVFGKIEKK
jgi:hypothetical protein